MVLGGGEGGGAGDDHAQVCGGGDPPRGFREGRGWVGPGDVAICRGVRAARRAVSLGRQTLEGVVAPVEQTIRRLDAQQYKHAADVF